MGATPPREHHPESPEGRLAAALLAGDEAGIRAARLAMVEGVDKWLWNHARRWWLGAGMKGEIGDYHAAAVIEAWKSALRFDPGRGIKFISYVTRVVRFGLSRVAANEAACGVHVPHPLGVTHCPTMQFSAITVADGEAVDFGATVAGREAAPDPPDRGEVWAAVRAALAGHPHARRWEEVLWLRYAAGAGLEDIGRRFGVTKESARQWLKLAQAELRRRKTVFEGVR